MLNRPWAGWAANAVQTGNRAPKDGAKNRGAAQSAKEELRVFPVKGGSASIFPAQVSKQVVFEPHSQLQFSMQYVFHISSHVCASVLCSSNGIWIDGGIYCEG